MGLSVEAMAIEMPAVDGHPNRVGFRGVLTLVDAISDKAPTGGRGHRVFLTRKAAEAAIPSLLGMALDYSPSWNAHDAKRKIGVITHAEVVGREIVIGGFLYGHDFPEVIKQIEGPVFPVEDADGNVRAIRDELGMSYEVTDVWVEDIRASIWVLNKVTFTGAAVLRRDKAAYRSTWIELEEQ